MARAKMVIGNKELNKIGQKFIESPYVVHYHLSHNRVQAIRTIESLLSYLKDMEIDPGFVLDTDAFFQSGKRIKR